MDGWIRGSAYFFFSAFQLCYKKKVNHNGIYQKVQPLKSSTTYGLNFLITEKFNYGVEQFHYQKIQPIYFMTL